MSAFVHNLRLEQYRAQRGLCWLCGEALDLFQPIHSYGACSWEHVIPRSHGGSNRRANLVLTHYECNQRRADKFIWVVQRPPRGARVSNPRPERKLQETRYLQTQFQRQVVPHVIKWLRESR